MSARSAHASTQPNQPLHTMQRTPELSRAIERAARITPPRATARLRWPDYLLALSMGLGIAAALVYGWAA